MNQQIYREQLLELWKHPLNKGIIENPSCEFKETNSFCGDEITIQLTIKNKIVKDAKFNGVGCVISIAMASLLTEEIKGKSLEEIKEINPEKIIKSLGVELNPIRAKCAMISLTALQKAIK